MSRKEYVVALSSDERDYLVQLVSAGKVSAPTLTRARILLKADTSPRGPNWGDARIAEAVEVSVSTVERVRRRYSEQGLKKSLVRKPQERPSRLPKLDGR